MHCSQHRTALCSEFATHVTRLSPCVQLTSSNARRTQEVRATSSSSSSSSQQVEELPGPRNAFVPGQESESRRQLFNRISPVYDEVRSRSMHERHCQWALPLPALAVSTTGAPCQANPQLSTSAWGSLRFPAYILGAISLVHCNHQRAQQIWLVQQGAVLAMHCILPCQCVISACVGRCEHISHNAAAAVQAVCLPLQYSMPYGSTASAPCLFNYCCTSQHQHTRQRSIVSHADTASSPCLFNCSCTSHHPPSMPSLTDALSLNFELLVRCCS
jgi:hypothetical protein